MKNGVWDIVPKPEGKSVVSSKWIYKIKHAADGSIVARGFSQKEGIDYEETTLKKYRRCHLEEVHEEDVPPILVEAETSPEIVASKYHDMIEPQETPTMDIS